MASEPILFRINLNHSFKDFDCGDPKINKFLLQDSIPHQKELFSVTYVIENNSDTIGFFSLFNDCIDIDRFPEEKDKAKWKRIRRKMPNGKRYDSFPAVKIGRLGIHTRHSGQKWGTRILDYLKQLFVTDNRTGCLFITVDAYAKSIDFYIKNGFDFMTDKDEKEETRQMYVQLKPIVLTT